MSHLHERAFLLLALASLLFLSCDHQESIRERGREALQVGDYSRAVQAWNELLDSKPGDHEARLGLATSWFSEAREIGRHHESDDAAMCWDHAARELRILLLQDSSEQVRSMASTSLFHLAKSRMDDNRLKDALDILSDATHLDTLNWFAWNLKGLVLEGLGRPDEARSMYEHVVASDPTFIAGYVNLGNLHWGQGEFKEALRDWSQGLKRDTANAYLHLWVERADEKLHGNTPTE